MSDILGTAFEAIGKAASPIKPALDFLMPDTGEQSDGFSIGNLINSAGQGLQNTFDEGLAGLGAVGYNAIAGEGTARERLLMGGMALAGAVGSARALHAGWKANRPAPTMRAMTAPSGYDKLTRRLGDPERFMDLTPDAQDLMRRKPGINRRQAQIMSADEGMAVARGFGRWADDDVDQAIAGAGLFDTYAARIPEQARGAQVDWARFDLGATQGVFSGKSKANTRIRELWARATTDPKSLKDPEADELFAAIKAFGDKTDIQVADDMTIGLAGRLVRADFVDGDPHLFVAHPPHWDDGMVVDPGVRAKRLAQLNHRALAEHGLGMLRKIYLLGEKEFNAYAADGTTALPKGLELGPNWYPQALEDVAREFNIDPNVDPAALDRAVAAVSFLSEAENWDTNIVKARKVLERIGDISDEDFQAWLRDRVEIDTRNPKLGRHQYAGRNAKKHQKRFNEIWDLVKKGTDDEQGFAVYDVTMKKILRLYGGVESVDDVFRTTKARKQRNFFLNIRHPDDEFPVTIDRHAYDAFLGLDSGIEDRPIDQSVFDGDEVYDVIADTYRALAQELSEQRGRLVRPHEVQAVIWETWRMLKGTEGRGGWNRFTEDGFEFPDPFMVPSPESTSNIVYDALIGRAGLTGAIGQDITGPIPLSLLDAKDVNGLTAVAIGEETVILSDVSDWTATRVRTKTPGVKGADGIFRWVDSTPQRVQDIQSHLNTKNQDVHFSEVSLVSDHPGGVHPAFRNNDVIVGYVEDGQKLRVPRGSGKLHRAGRTLTQTQGLSYEKLGPDDINPDTWRKPGSPIDTHAWSAISAELTPAQVKALGLSGHDNVAATNRLRAELQRRGYKPIDQDGFYGSTTPEKSFLVFGITPQEAREIGEMFNQDSVITNDGFLYNRNRTNEPEDLGRRREATGLEKDPQPVEDQPPEKFFRSELVIGGKRLKWRQDLNWDQTEDVIEENLVQRRSSTRQRIEIDVAPGQDISNLAYELEARGLKDLSIYAATDKVHGFERAYETVASDGHSFATQRTSKGAVTATHGGHVFVRSASGLPASTPSEVTSWSVRGDGVAVAGNSLLVDGRFPTGTVEFTGPFQAKLNGQSPLAWGYTGGTLTPIFDEAELNSGRFSATIKKGQITPADPNDIRGAIEAHQALVDAGYPELAIPTPSGKPGKMTLKGPNGTFEFGAPKETKATSELVTTKNGLLVQPTHRDFMVPAFSEKYGLEFSAGWREGKNQHLHLDDRTISQVDAGLAVVMDIHAPVVHRARLRGLSTESIPVDERKANQVAFAKFPWRADSEIILTREFFNEPRMFEAALREARDPSERWLSPRVEPTPTGIIVHEMGHVMHLAARLGEGMTKSSAIDKEIIALLGGGRQWKKVAEKEISQTAAIEVSELIAESVSEVLLSPRPSKLARDVYAILVDKMGDYMRFRDLTA